MDATPDGRIGLAHGSGSAGGVAPRIRSRVACQACNGHKVKCDVAQTRPPCSNCQRHELSCVVLPRKKHRPRRNRNANVADPSATTQLNGDGQASSPIPPENNSQSAEEEPLEAKNSGDESMVPEDGPLSYLGDGKGPKLSVYDLCHPGTPQVAGSYQSSKQTARQAHRPHEVDFMRQQGVFTELPKDIADDLIRCYFHHVHFYLPIVDTPFLLNEYHRHGTENISPLLLWSMFLASANFADMDILKRAGFSSRKAMKASMYERAKCLYDMDRGTDKLVLIQSVILLAFWYADPQDHTGSWYWIGVAISLSQSLGLHRTPRSSSRSQQSSPAKASLTRRIWWTCVVRDRWVSLAKGRPMRIHSEDCDTPMPVLQDVTDEIGSVESRARAAFIPIEFRALTEMWLRLVRITDVLGGILRLHYRVRGPPTLVTDVDRFANDLESLASKDSISDGLNDDLSIHAHQIELLHQATIAILYRPYVLSESTSPPAGAHPLWQKNAVRRARDAASSTNNLLQGLIELDAIKYIKPMIITAMIPAMQIHLADCKSTNSLVRGLAKNKLQLCMLVLSNMRTTYWSANVMYQLFQRAQTLLGDTALDGTKSANATTTTPLHSTMPDGDFQRVTTSETGPAPNEAEAIIASVPPVVLDQEAEPLWFNFSPQFSNVDQLLSPGFSIGEDVFLDFLPNYPSAVVYNQHILLPNPVSEETLYSGMSF